MTQYTKILGTDFTENEIHIPSFYQEILESSLPNLEMIYQQGNDVVMRFATTLSGEEETTLNNLCTNYNFVIYDNVFATIKDVKSVGTHGGTATKNIWNIRDLNTLEGNQSFVSIANNQIIFTQESGNFIIKISAPAYKVKNHQIRLWDATNSEVIVTGTSEYSNANVVTRSTIDTVLIKGNTSLVLEVQHQVERTNTNDGFGVASAFNTDETYTTVTITRL